MSKEERIVKIVSDTVVTVSVSLAAGVVCKCTRSALPLIAMLLVPALRSTGTVAYVPSNIVNKEEVEND